jgi:hypothetical protein
MQFGAHSLEAARLEDTVTDIAAFVKHRELWNGNHAFGLKGQTKGSANNRQFAIACRGTRTFLRAMCNILAQTFGADRGKATRGAEVRFQVELDPTLDVFLGTSLVYVMILEPAAI